MSKAAPAEPSMEDILASIRRIIADEEPAKPPVKAAPEPEPVVAPAPNPWSPRRPVEEIDPVEAAFAAADAEPEVLDLKPDQIAATPAPKPAPKAALRPAAPDPFEDIDFAEAEPNRRRNRSPPRRPRPSCRRCRSRPQPAPAAFHVPVANDGALLGTATQHAVANAFGTLETAVFGSSGRTVEDLTKELLRPMLRSGSTTTCRPSSSGWCARKSSASPAGGAERSRAAGASGRRAGSRARSALPEPSSPLSPRATPARRRA